MSANPFAALFGLDNEGLTSQQLAEVGEFLEEREERKIDDEVRGDLHQILADIAGRAAATSPVTRHTTPANKISMPVDMSLSEGQKVLAREQEAEEKETGFNYRFPYKYEDGLVAVEAVLQAVYGMSAKGITRFDFFTGAEPPQKINIQVGVDEFGQPVNKSVPSTPFHFGPIEATISFGQWADGANTGLFQLNVQTKVKHSADAEALNIMTRRWLDTRSIYRGQILTFDPSGANGYGLTQVDRRVDETIVYSEEVRRRLTNKVWDKITQSGALKAAGKRTDFRVLMHGPLGTGKSAGMVATAVLARANHRTVIEYRPTEHASVAELQKVFTVAKMYGPTVILVEDYDRFFPLDTHNRSMLTNLLDGVDKSGDVSLLMTTNFLDRVDPSVVRPPRMTGLIEIKHLDRDGIEQLLHLTLGDKLADDIDFDAVWDVVQDYSPAFIRSTFDEAEAIGIQQDDHGKITTAALVAAAEDLHDQDETYKRLTEAQNGVEVDHLALGLGKLLADKTTNQGLVETVRQQVSRVIMYDHRSSFGDEEANKGETY